VTLCEGRLGFPNPAHIRIRDPLHVFRATALPCDVPSDERRCQVLNLWPGVPLDPGLSDLTRVATVIPARRGPMPRRRRARAAGALSGASATLVFGHRPSTSRPPSASCRPFCYGLPGLMRSRERTASRRSAVSVLRTTARWAEVLHESLSRRSGRAVRASSGVETQSGRVRSEGDLEAGARRAEQRRQPSRRQMLSTLADRALDTLRAAAGKFLADRAECLPITAAHRTAQAGPLGR